MTIRECPCCGDFSRRVLHEQKFAKIEGVSVLGGYVVVACDCGMVFASDIPVQAEFDHYYATASKYDGPASLTDQNRLVQVADVIAEIWPDRSARVLDVGCADGALLRNLRARGFSRVAGVDPSPRCVALADQLYHVDVRHGTVADLNTWDASSDLITLIGVLEHVRDVGPCLDVLRSRLAPGGALYVEVPDAGAFTPAGTAPFQEFSPEHVNFFDRDTLAATAARHGLTMTWQRCEYRCGPGDWKMPTLCAVLARAEGPRLPVEAYIAASEATDGVCRHIWDVWAGNATPFYVWGAGALALRMVARSPHGAKNVAAFIDNNPRYHGKTIAGVPVIAPDALADMPTHFILIASVGHAEAIHADITRRGLRNAVGSL